MNHRKEIHPDYKATRRTAYHKANVSISLQRGENKFGEVHIFSNVTLYNTVTEEYECSFWIQHHESRITDCVLEEAIAMSSAICRVNRFRCAEMVLWDGKNRYDCDPKTLKTYETVWMEDIEKWVRAKDQ